MNIKRNIIFALESRKKNGVPIVENVPIRMRVIYASQRIEFTTGYRIDVAKWDADKQRVKNGCTNKLKQSASEINADLLRQYTEIQNIFKEFEVQNVLPTPAQIKDSFNARMKDAPVTEQETAEGPKISFWEAFEEFVRECGKQNDWTDATYEKFAAVKNHLKEFRDELSFDTFTENGLNDYVDFLRNKKDMRNSTIGKQISFLKWFLRWSFKKGYNQNMAYDSFKPKLKNTPKKVIFLTWEELNRLKDYKIPKTHCCFISHLVCFFRCDLSGFERLANLVGNDIVLLLSAGDMLILPFGEQELLVSCLCLTLIRTDELAVIGFCGILRIVCAVCQTLSHRLSLVHMESNQSCRCHSFTILSKKKKPPKSVAPCHSLSIFNCKDFFNRNVKYFRNIPR